MGEFLLLAMLVNIFVLIWAQVLLWMRRGRPVVWALGSQAAITALAFLVYLAQSGDAAVEHSFYFGVSLAILVVAALLSGLIRLARGPVPASQP